ncbi:hypothetical protein ABZZ01_19870 [Streptomyces virginiae]|uniref:hypothetical protein n=1 Tax=Streptomyces virginiae TaxID=1961 RepID=UPI0033B282AC
MNLIASLILAAFGLVAVAGNYLSAQRAASRSTEPIMPTGATDPHGRSSSVLLGEAVNDLRDVLHDAPGTHTLLYSSEHHVRVLSYEGDALACPGLDVTAPDAAETVHQALDRAGVHAEVEQHLHGFTPGVAITLRTAEDMRKLVQVVIAGLPPLRALVREMSKVLKACGFPHAGAVRAAHDRAWGLVLTLDDARRVRVALGEPDLELVAFGGRELYVIADALADLLRERLGGQRVDVTARPSRGDLCHDCLDELLEVGPLTAAQAEALTEALVRFLMRTQ